MGTCTLNSKTNSKINPKTFCDLKAFGSMETPYFIADLTLKVGEKKQQETSYWGEISS